jgi:hypothetical protein
MVKWGHVNMATENAPSIPSEKDFHTQINGPNCTAYGIKE